MNIDFSTYRINGLGLAPDFYLHGAVYAATYQTLLVSRDGGQTWQDALQAVRAGQAVPVMSVLCTRKGTVLAGISGGILSSKDGNLWQSEPFGTPLPVVSALAETTSGDLLVGTIQDGVFVSRDGGISWSRWNFGLLDSCVYTLLATQATIYAGVETGIFASTNNGRAWREVNFLMDDAPVLGLYSLEDGSLFAGTESGKLFRSMDQGQTWQPAGQGIFDAEINALAGCAGSVYIASGNQLWISADRGENWQEWRAPRPVDGDFTCLAGGKRIVLAGTSGGQIFLI